MKTLPLLLLCATNLTSERRHLETLFKDGSDGCGAQPVAHAHGPFIGLIHECDYTRQVFVHE